MSNNEIDFSVGDISDVAPALARPLSQDDNDIVRLMRNSASTAEQALPTIKKAMRIGTSKN